MTIPRVASLKSFWIPSNEASVKALKALATDMRMGDPHTCADDGSDIDVIAFWADKLERIITELTDHR